MIPACFFFALPILIDMPFVHGLCLNIEFCQFSILSLLAGFDPYFYLFLVFFIIHVKNTQKHKQLARMSPIQTLTEKCFSFINVVLGFYTEAVLRKAQKEELK